MNIIKSILGVIDFLPGMKTNSGALILLITVVAQLLGASGELVALIKALAEALMAYGLAMKGARAIIK